MTIKVLPNFKGLVTGGGVHAYFAGVGMRCVSQRYQEDFQREYSVVWLRVQKMCGEQWRKAEEPVDRWWMSSTTGVNSSLGPGSGPSSTAQGFPREGAG